jgi:hypothetical protein
LALGWYCKADQYVNYEASIDGNYLIAFNVREVHGFGNELGDGALSTSCWASDQPDVVMIGLWLTGGI